MISCIITNVLDQLRDKNKYYCELWIIRWLGSILPQVPSSGIAQDFKEYRGLSVRKFKNMQWQCHVGWFHHGEWSLVDIMEKVVREKKKVDK